LIRRPIQFKDSGSPPAGLRQRTLLHPFFSWMGLRPVQAQHTAAEHQALERHAEGRRMVVEIGVAEGASAIALRDKMDQEGELYLIDPYHLSRVPALNFLKRAARRAVSGPNQPTIHWIESFSYDAAMAWQTPIDFLLIDGDHSEAGVQQDWNDWHPHVKNDGIVAFHDARLFPGGWTSAAYGPVKFVDQMFRPNGHSRWKIIDEVDSLVFVARQNPTS
jgi:predicted O-methyltransferase YrrM